MSFATAVQFVLKEEGGFQNNPRDDGNWTGGKQGVGENRGTKYGISARSYPTLDIINLTETEATAIYFNDFWTPIGGRYLPPGADLLVLDCAVNQGLSFAVATCQNVARVKADGRIGPVTGAAAAGVVFLNNFAAARAVRYAISRRFTDFGESWMHRLMRAHSAALQSALPAP